MCDRTASRTVTTIDSAGLSWNQPSCASTLVLSADSEATMFVSHYYICMYISHSRIGASFDYLSNM